MVQYFESKRCSLKQSISYMSTLFICLSILSSSASLGYFDFASETPAREERRERSADYHDKGLSYAMEGQYEDAVGLFRAAVRNNGNSTEALNDLGVTEMRIGELHRAKRRFWRCLKLDPNQADCKRNAADLKKYMGDVKYNLGKDASPQQRHMLSKPREVSAKELMSIRPGSRRAHELLSEPFVVRGALEQWGWRRDLQEAYSMSKLATMSAYGIETVEFYPQGMGDEACAPFFADMEASHRWILDPIGAYSSVDASQEGSVIQWNLAQDKWEDLLERGGPKHLPEVFSDRWWTGCMGGQDATSLLYRSTHWKMLIAGERGAGMFNHQDYLPTASFQAQLAGSKSWHICAPDQTPNMYNAGDVDAFYPDYERWPKFKDAACLQTVVTPGDVIYYPENYWHQTLNHDTFSVALSSSIILKSNFEAVSERLSEECEGNRAIFAPSDELCIPLKKCYKQWQHHFDSEENGSSEL